MLLQSSVDRLEFQAAKPDVLSHFAPAIIERLNARGKTTQDALKALCLDRKGLEAEVRARPPCGGENSCECKNFILYVH